MLAADKARFDLHQALRSTTAADGTLTWTFAKPYPVGTLPVIALTPVGANDDKTYNHKVTALSNTAVTVKMTVSQPSLVALLGLNLLVVQASAAVVVHITAQPATQ